MAFDATVVCSFINEASTKIIGSKIEKIYEPQKDELAFIFRNTNLFISANPSFPRIFLSNKKPDNPSSPPMFCMLLRKKLVGGIITDITQIGFERIVIFTIKSQDELGDYTEKKLIVEIMGRHSNIILTDENNMIIDSIKRVDFTVSSVRQILPGLFYELPPKQEKNNPLVYDFKNINIPENKTCEQYLMENFYGISKLFAREISYLSEKNKVSDVLETEFNKIKNYDFKPCLIIDKNKNVIDFSATPITQYENLCDIIYFDSISKVIEEFYYTKAKNLKLKQGSSKLTTLIENNIERCSKKIIILNKQLNDALDREKYKKQADLITANIYKIKEGANYVIVNDYFNNNEEIKINLDPTLSPSKNAQKLYNKYTKLKTAGVEAKKQLKLANNELNYLESVLDFIQRIEDLSELSVIKDELEKEGYLKNRQSKPKKISKTQDTYLKFTSVDNYEIFVGKNNYQNDYLTLKLSRSNDLWFHTKNIPGSHVIVKSKGEEIPASTIKEAAILAATHSKAQKSSNVPVDYTIVKNVKKPSGAKPGMVIYDNYKTIYVTPTQF